MNFEIGHCSKKYTVNYKSIPTYLQYTGWSKVKEKDGRVLYHYIQSPQITLIVPSFDSSDLDFRIRDMIRVLEAVERRSGEEIIESINKVEQDIWKISIAKGTNIDSISVSIFEKFIKNIKNIIEYSASAEQEAKPYFEKSLSTGQKYTKECKIGKTFTGSYGINVEIPLQDITINKDNQSVIASEIPLGRKITERVFKSLKLVEEEKEIEDITPIYTNSINGNISLALKNLLELYDGDLEYSVKLSPIVEAPLEMRNNPTICLKHSNIDYLDNLYKKMYKGKESTTSTIIGTIVELEHIFDNKNDRDYNIKIRGTHNNKTHEYHVALNEEDYLKACHIHTNSVETKKEKFIQIIGEVRRTKRGWYVDSYSNFELHEVEDEVLSN